MTIQELYYAKKYLEEKITQVESPDRYIKMLDAVEKLIEMMIQYHLKN